MKVQLILVPYDSGRRDAGQGRGPEHLVRAGLVDRLRAQGHEVAVETIADDPDRTPAEVRTAFELMRRLSVQVRASRDAGRFPLVLAGNCNTACGTLSGLTPHARSVFWFDAHGDVNTPSTTLSGYVDGTGLAAAMGLGWEGLAASIPGFEPVSPSVVSLLGARDLDPPERNLIDRLKIAVLPSSRLEAELDQLLARPHVRDTLAYVHCDLDALDPSVGRSSFYQAAGGLSVKQLTSAVAAIGAAVDLGAAAITAFDPGYDTGGAIARAALDIADAIVTSVDAGGTGGNR